MKSNRVSVLATAAMLSLGLTACGVIGSQADDSPVIIGADLELSGANAAVGKVYQDALELEVSQINANGGADGHPLQLVIKDNHTQPQTAVTDIASLTADPNLAAVVTGSCSACLAAVAQTLQDKKVPTISLAAADLTSLTAAAAAGAGSGGYLFKINPNAEDDAVMLAGQLQSDPSTPAHDYAVLTTDDAYGNTLASDLESQATKSNATETAKEQVAAGASDSRLRQAVQEAVDESPDALVIALLPDQATAAVAVAREERFSGAMYFDAIGAGDLFFNSDQTRNQMSGVSMVAPQDMVIDDVIATSPAETAAKEWFDAYTSKYGAFSAYSLYAADAIQLVANAIGTAHSTQRDQLRDAFENTQMEGFAGPLRFTPDSHSGLSPQALANVTVTDDGRWHLTAS
ncbi:ABC transporter substrate-binding protein [Rugosimonospora acidiphila]|uniref:ABC transporter substrate-binding protein n=1 Tax=Rugosimonospora acidiphila TaxID=556531 RepID=A0ABP9RI71_9ACTN